jgi:release factor glutamine methyltransferase
MRRQTVHNDRPKRSPLTAAERLHDAERRLSAARIDDGRLEAEVLLAHALGRTREALFARLRDEVDGAASEAFEGLLARRLSREPLAHITGRREFYGLDLLCTGDALIPRQETELIVELALVRVKGQGSRAKIADVGTGNGAIAVAVAVHAPDVRVLATDVSGAALRLARRNAERHGVAPRIAFVQGSLLGPLRGMFDVIVANPPYVSDEEYVSAAPELHREPEEALRAGPLGTEVIEELLRQAPARLARGGLLLIEHAWDQGERLREAARASLPAGRIETRGDLSEQERVLVAVNG